MPLLDGRRAGTHRRLTGLLTLVFVASACQLLVGPTPEDSSADTGGTSGAAPAAAAISGNFGQGGAPTECGPDDNRCPANCGAAADPDCRLSLGAPCGRNAECISLSCVSGVCCNSSCEGKCATCDQAGRCHVPDTTTDPLHCGTCDNECKYGICQKGICADVVLGETKVGGTAGNFPGNQLRCLRAVAEQELELVALGINTVGDHALHRLALYSGSETRPQNLIVQTDEMLAEEGWSVAQIPNTRILPGTYHLCLLAEEMVGLYFADEPFVMVEEDFSYQPFPQFMPLVEDIYGPRGYWFAMGYVSD